MRAINVADVHVLTQDMVHHAERQRLLVFCDNRQDAAFQAGWMKDHARRFRLRALMAEGVKAHPRSVGDLTGYLVRPAGGGRNPVPRPDSRGVAGGPGAKGAAADTSRNAGSTCASRCCAKVALSARQSLGLEPWGRMKVEYDGLDVHSPWMQERAPRAGHLRGAPARRRGRARSTTCGASAPCMTPSTRSSPNTGWRGTGRFNRATCRASWLPNATKLRREPDEKGRPCDAMAEQRRRLRP